MVARERLLEEDSKKTTLDLFKPKRLRRNMFVMILLWLSMSGLFDAHVRNIVNLNYSIYATFTFSALLEFPADMLTIWGLDWIGRRWSASLAFLLSGVFSLACVFAFDSSVVVVAFSLMARFVITYGMNTGQQIIFELLPTELRGQGFAVVNFVGIAATMLSPLIVYSSEFVSPSSPFIILGVAGVLASMLPVMLPETAHEALADTVEQADAFGKDQGFFHVPILNKHLDKKANSVQSIHTQVTVLER